MYTINRFFISIVYLVLFLESTKQSHVKQAKMTVKAIGKTIKSPLLKQIGNTIIKPVTKTFGNIKNSMGIFRRNKNTIKNFACGIQEKCMRATHNFGSKTVKYLGTETIKNLKYTAPLITKGGNQLVRAAGKQSIQMRSAAQIRGKGFGPIVKKSTQFMNGAEFSSLLNMVSRSKSQLPLLLVTGGLNKLTQFNLVPKFGDMDFNMEGATETTENLKKSDESNHKNPKLKKEHNPNQNLQKSDKGNERVLNHKKKSNPNLILQKFGGSNMAPNPPKKKIKKKHKDDDSEIMIDDDAVDFGDEHLYNTEEEINKWMNLRQPGEGDAPIFSEEELAAYEKSKADAKKNLEVSGGEGIDFDMQDEMIDNLNLERPDSFDMDVGQGEVKKVKEVKLDEHEEFIKHIEDYDRRYQKVFDEAMAGRPEKAANEGEIPYKEPNLIRVKKGPQEYLLEEEPNPHLDEAFPEKSIVTQEDGNTYQGDLIDGKMQGKGRLTFPNGKIYEGDFVDGISQGEGKLIYPDGSVYEGGFKNNKFEGKGKYSFAGRHSYEGEDFEREFTKEDSYFGYGIVDHVDGPVFEGEFFGGNIMGKGKFTYPTYETFQGDFRVERLLKDEKLAHPTGGVYDGDYICEQFNGKGRQVNGFGEVYEGDLVDATMQGKGKLTHPNGGVYDGEFLNGCKEGKGKFEYSNGDVYNGEWLDNSKNGFGKMQYSNGNYYEGNWNQDRYHGEGTYYYANKDHAITSMWKNAEQMNIMSSV